MAGSGINSSDYTTIGRISFEKNGEWKGKRKNEDSDEYIEGRYGTNAFVKRMQLSKDREIGRELYSLEKSGNFHENIIRFFGSESDGKFRYIATEWCYCSVADLITGRVLQDKKQQIISSLSQKSMLRQMSEAVAFLHSLDLIHRNLKPNNFMIAEVATQPQVKYTIKLTDMCKSKNIMVDPENSGTLATDYWVAPEMLMKGVNLDHKMDTFILGCVFYYVASKGSHPFGEGVKRQANICDPSHQVYQGHWDHQMEAKLASLFKRMIKFQQKSRPTMQKVLEDNFFKPSDEEIYELYAGTKKAGLCVIINQEKFQKTPNADGEKLKDRPGTEKDCQRLKQTFLNLGFDVFIRTNVEGHHLEWEMLELARSDCWKNNQYGSLAVCILSHGSEGKVYGVDGVGVEIKTLKYLFNSENSPGLYGKPKMFIVQACQGDMHQDIGSSASNVSQPQSTDDVPFIPVDKQIEVQRLHPSIMDLIDLMSTVPGFSSYRDTNFGTPFIRFLCDELKKSGQDGKEISDIFRKVQTKMRQTLIGPEKLKILTKQICELRTSLEKKLVFKIVPKGGRGKILQADDKNRPVF